MKSRIKTMWLHVLALLFVASFAHAQPAQQAQSNFSQPELEQMLAPIALYPDALLSQILMASTYPTEVVEASYWLKANPELKGEAAVKAAESQQWDISVKSLLPFPQVLSTMEAKQDWVVNLGNAFLGQEQQVMDTIQSLRQKAMAAGYLKSDNRVRVVQEDQLISINLVQPSAVYVPYYNPTVVYGTWWAPQYAPVYWDPWPGYAVAPGGYGWAWAPVATVVTIGVLYAAFNWRHRHIYHHRHVNYWSRHYHYDHYRYRGTNTRWSHDYRHRRDIPYRHTTVNQRFGSRVTDYNRRVGPRPTTRDIRDGRYTPTRVSTTGARATTRTGTNPYAGFKSGRTGDGATGGRTGGRTGATGLTGRTGTAATGGRTGAAATGTTGRTGAGATGGRTGSGARGIKSTSNRGSNPPGVAHGVRGTQPSAGAAGGRTGGRTGATGLTGRTGSGAQGIKSTSNRGSNPPGVAHGVRGTQPSAATKIRSTGNTGRTGAGAAGGRTGAGATGARTGARTGAGATGARTGGAGKPAAASRKPAAAKSQPVRKKPGEK